MRTDGPYITYDLNTKLRTVRKSEWVAFQLRQARDENHITTRVGHRIPVPCAFRCLYCGEFFSQTGAEKHFGQTRIEHNGGKMGFDKTIEVAAKANAEMGGY